MNQTGVVVHAFRLLRNPPRRRQITSYKNTTSSPATDSLEAEARDQGRGMGARCCRSYIWARRRRFRVNHTDCGRAAETQLHADTNDHVGRGGNRGRKPGDIPSVRQGKQRQRPGADGVGLPLRWLPVPWLRRLRLRWLPWLWLRRRLRLPLQRLRLASCGASRGCSRTGRDD